MHLKHRFFTVQREHEMIFCGCHERYPCSGRCAIILTREQQNRSEDYRSTEDNVLHWNHFLWSTHKSTFIFTDKGKLETSLTHTICLTDRRNASDTPRASQRMLKMKMFILTQTMHTLRALSRKKFFFSSSTLFFSTLGDGVDVILDYDSMRLEADIELPVTLVRSLDCFSAFISWLWRIEVVKLFFLWREFMTFVLLRTLSCRHSAVMTTSLCEKTAMRRTWCKKLYENQS